MDTVSMEIPIKVEIAYLGSREIGQMFSATSEGQPVSERALEASKHKLELAAWNMLKNAGISTTGLNSVVVTGDGRFVIRQER